MSEEFTSELLSEINLLRTNPKNVKSLQDYKQYILSFYSYKEDLLKSIDSLTKKLSSSKPISALSSNETLQSIAEDFLNQLHYTSTSKFYAQDQDYLEVVLSYAFDGIQTSRNYLTTEKKPVDSLMTMLFNEEDASNNTIPLLEPSIEYIGIAHDDIKGKPVTIVILSDSVTPCKEKPLKESLIDEINKVRSNPKALIKYLPEKNKEYKTVVDYLNKAKRVGGFIKNDALCKAAEERLKKFKEGEKNYNYEQLVDFLSLYGDRYVNVNEYIANSEPAKEFIISLMMSSNDNRNILYNRKLKQIGFAETEEEDDVVLLFADKFEGKKELKELTVLSLRRRLHRPNFTEDEMNQMQNDFKMLDVNNSGVIKPSTILLFCEKNEKFKKKNPFYYNALKNLNTEENNANGVSCDEFVNAVQKVIIEKNMDFEKNWKEIYDLYFDETDKKKEKIDKDILTEIIKRMGFNVNEEDITELIEKMDGDLNEKKFINIMKIIELRFIQKQKMK